MSDDPIVEETHQTRERLLREYGGIENLIREFQIIEAEMKDRVVTLEPRSPIETARRVS